MSSLANKRDLTTAAVGATVWYLGALLIKQLPPKVFAERKNTALLYAGTIPLTYPMIWGFVKAAGLKTLDQIIRGTSLGTAVAIMLDGVALVWYNDLYGGPGRAASAGAYILWTGGCGLFWSLVLTKK